MKHYIITIRLTADEQTKPSTLVESACYELETWVSTTVTVTDANIEEEHVEPIPPP